MSGASCADHNDRYKDLEIMRFLTFLSELLLTTKYASFYSLLLRTL